MDKEKALKIWLPVIADGVKKLPECKESLEMAIKALENQKSLQAELEEIKETFCDMRDGYPKITDETLTVREVIEVIDKRIKKLKGE